VSRLVDQRHGNAWLPIDSANTSNLLITHLQPVGQGFVVVSLKRIWLRSKRGARHIHCHQPIGMDGEG